MENTNKQETTEIKLKEENTEMDDKEEDKKDKKRKELENKDGGEGEENKKPKRLPKRRLALIMGYLGVKYHGFQFQSLIIFKKKTGKI